MDLITPTAVLQAHFIRHIKDIRYELGRSPMHFEKIAQIFNWMLALITDIFGDSVCVEDNSEDKCKCYDFIQHYISDIIAVEREIHMKMLVAHCDTGYPHLRRNIRQAVKYKFERLLADNWVEFGDCWIDQMTAKYELAYDYATANYQILYNSSDSDSDSDSNSESDYEADSGVSSEE